MTVFGDRTQGEYFGFYICFQVEHQAHSPGFRSTHANRFDVRIVGADFCAEFFKRCCYRKIVYVERETVWIF